MKNLIYLLSFILLVSCNLFAQNEENSSEEKDEFFNFHLSEFLKAPTVTLDYGRAKMNSRNISQSFSDNYFIELKLGFTNETEHFRADDLLKYRYRYFFVGNYSQNYGKSISDNSRLDFDLWRFGLVTSTGFGYRFGSTSVIPYHSGSFIWSVIEFDDAIYPEEQRTLDRIQGSLRFGTSTESGVRFRLPGNIVLDAGYERSLLFPRHLFFKWAMGAAIEGVGQSLVDNFVKEILKNSPYAVPVMSALLKGALSYGIYELREKNMHFPFNTEAPIAYDQFKFGVALVF
jgi:hypothetical protein